MIKILLPLVVIIFFSSGHSFGQSGPAGVGNSTTNALWYDLEAQGLANNANISQLLDRSGNNNSLTQSTLAKQPVFLTNQINGKPAISFTGSNKSLSSTGFANLSGINQLSFFIVGQSSSGTNNPFFLGIGSSTNTGAIRMQRLAGGWRPLFPTAGSVTSLTYAANNSYNIHSTVWNGSTPRFRSFQNATLQGTNNTANGSIATNNGVILGRALHVGGGQLNGQIAEVIVYNTAVNNAQRIIIENYLAAKYALTISNDKYTHQGTHPNEVAGIGFEGAGDFHNDAQGTGVVRVRNPSSLNVAGDYMMFGHDGGALTGTTAELPAALSGTGSKLVREWVAEITTGNVGTVTISFDLDGYSLGTDPAEYRLLLDTDGNFSNATIVGSPSGTNTITFNNVDLYTFGPFFTLANTGDVGECVSFNTVNALWTAAPGSTWDCGVTPDSTSNVIIDAGFVRRVTGTQSCNDLTVDGELIIESGGTLIIKGDASFNSVLTCNSGSNIIFRGTEGIQLIENNTGGTVTFHNVTTNNLNNVRFLSGDFAVTGGISLLNGQFQNTTSLTLVSNAGSTGHIARVDGGTFGGAGTYTVQRFMSGRQADWNDITNSGVIGADIEDLNDEIFISGIPGGDGYAAQAGGGSFVSMWFFNNITDLYEAPTSTSDPFELGRGYETWLGDNLTTWNAKAWDLNGAQLNLANTDVAINSAGGGWNLIGNPFPAFVDFSVINASIPSINGDAFWYYDADSSQFNFRGPNAIIPPGQGFWLNISSNATVNFNPSTVIVDGIENNSQLYKRSELPGLKLEVKAENSNYGSAVHVWKDRNAFVGMDAQDLPPLKVPDPKAVNMWMDNGGLESMVNYINPEEEHLEIPIVVESGEAGDFVMNFKGLSQFQDYQCINILNESTEEQVDVSAGSPYKFTVAEDLQPIRFRLLLSKQDYEDCLAPASLRSDQIRVFADNKQIHADFYLDRSVNANIHVYNSIGNLVYSNVGTVGYSRETIDLHHVPSGMYIVQISINGQVSNQKVILQ